MQLSDGLLSLSESVEEPRSLVDDFVSSDDEAMGSDNSGSSEKIGDSEEYTRVTQRNDNLISNSNPGWADAMAKVLKTSKPKRKKYIVLSKAKKLQDITKKDKTDVGFEVEGGMKEEAWQTEEIKQEPEEKIQRRKLKKKLWENKGRLQPNVLDKNRERALAKIATKGVVQLFNAVQQHQRQLNQQFKEVGTSELKKDKIIKSIDKRKFLDVLMGKDDVKVDQVGVNAVKEREDSETSTWKVLQDDFMSGAKLKDWDRNEIEKEIEMEFV